jgi:hypothetical protein
MLGIRFDIRSSDWPARAVKTPLCSIRDANLVRERANTFGGVVHNTTCPSGKQKPIDCRVVSQFEI